MTGSSAISCIPRQNWDEAGEEKEILIRPGLHSPGAIISTISDMMKYLRLRMTEELPYLAMSQYLVGE